MLAETESHRQRLWLWKILLLYEWLCSKGCGPRNRMGQVCVSQGVMGEVLDLLYFPGTHTNTAPKSEKVCRSRWCQQKGKWKGFFLKIELGMGSAIPRQFRMALARTLRLLIVSNVPLALAQLPCSSPLPCSPLSSKAALKG